jgi:lipoprotein NlpD
MNRSRAVRAVLSSLVLSALLAGCAGSSRVQSAQKPPPPAAAPPIREQSVSIREPASPYREVAHGDTLYSIAWETGRDYRELAAWNQIAPPYVIRPGQRLRVAPPPVTEQPAARKPLTPAAPKSAKGSAPAAKPKTARTDRPAKVGTKAVAPAAKKDASRADKGAKPAAAPAVAAGGVPTPTTGNKTRETNAARARAKTTAGGVRTAGWSWPAAGEVLNRYSESESKGLDIAGPRGGPVLAAAAGRVVYQGSGLRGYGQLIIIKHSDEFLSAYAHNDRIHVKEGDAVTRGQKIADMGSTGTDRIKLHFEIRRQGVPVDPMKYLPKR